MNLLCRIYAVLLYAYPADFRAQFGGEMQQVFRDRCRAVAETHDSSPSFCGSSRPASEGLVHNRIQRGVRRLQLGSDGPASSRDLADGDFPVSFC